MKTLDPPREVSMNHFFKKFEEGFSKGHGSEFAGIAFEDEENKTFPPRDRRFTTEKNFVED